MFPNKNTARCNRLRRIGETLRILADRDWSLSKVVREETARVSRSFALSSCTPEASNCSIILQAFNDNPGTGYSCAGVMSFGFRAARLAECAFTIGAFIR